MLSEPSRPRSRRTSGAAAHLRRHRVLLFIRSFVLPLLPSEAIELYTPMGERRWVPDWEPTFPAGPSDDDTDPGTVSPRRLTVTRPYGSSPSDRTSASECQPAQPRSEVVVTDLTALSARGQQVIERFAEDFGSFLDGWRRSIEAA